MSLYQLQKLLYHVNRDAERANVSRDPAAFVKRYELRSGRRPYNVDARALYVGVHSLLCALHAAQQSSNEEYKALKTGVSHPAFACADQPRPGMTA
jgi:hypothetical protein